MFGGDVGGVLRGFFVRVIASGLYSHVLYTGLVGMAIAIVTTRRDDRPLRDSSSASPACCAGAAVFGHFLWNSPILEFFPAQPWEGADWFLIPVATAVKGLPLRPFVALAIRLAGARERRWLHETLTSEFGEEAVTPEERRSSIARDSASAPGGSCVAERGSARPSSSGVSNASR